MLTGRGWRRPRDLREPCTGRAHRAPLTESDLTGTINEEYIYFNGERIARVDRPSGTVHYYFSNHLGSHTMVTSATGSCEQDVDYFPYGGEITDHCPNVAQHYKFTGKERDTESGLDNFEARYFASTMGRFLTPDAMLVTGRHLINPQKWNRYAYVHNNPLAFVDPDGLDDWFVFRPLVGTSTPNSPRWQAAVNQAEARGDKVHMLKGSNATVKAYNQALQTPDAHVIAITHAGAGPNGGTGGIELSNGGISSGSFGSESTERTQSTDPSKASTLNVNETLSFDIFGERSSDIRL